MGRNRSILIVPATAALILTGCQVSRPASTATTTAAISAIDEVRRLERFSAWVEDVCFSPDGRYVATALGRKGQNATIWQVATGRKLKELNSESYRLFRVEFSLDGKKLLGCGGFGGTLWDAETWKVLKTFRHSADTLDARFSPDGRQIATGGWDRTVHLWDSESGDEIRTLTGHGRTVISLAFSPDGKWLVSGDTLGTILVWNMLTGSGKAVHRLTNGGVPFDLEFAPDGRTFASTAGNDVVLWDVGSGTETRRLSGHADEVRHAVFSPGGRYLLSCSGQFAVKRDSDRLPDASVRLWEVASGREIARFEGHSGFVASVVFSPDGRLAASAGHDGTVRICRLPELKEPIPVRRSLPD
jgi:WD40 repeat protein